MTEFLSDQLAEDVLTMAVDGGMPDSRWTTDPRIARACEHLGWGPLKARLWAQGQSPYRETVERPK